MDLETINAMTTAGQQLLQSVLGIAGCASSAEQIKKFFEKNVVLNTLEEDIQSIFDGTYEASKNSKK